MASKSFGNAAATSVEGLRQGMEAAFVAAEAASAADVPVIHSVVDTAGGFPEADGGVMELAGAGLLGGGTFDSCTLVKGDAELTVAAMRPGVSGYSVQMLLGVAGLSAALVGKKLVVTLATGGSTAHDVATLLNGGSTDWAGILRANEDAAGTFDAAIAETALAGGTGDIDGYAVYVGGETCTLAASAADTSTAVWADGAITCTVPDLTPLASGDVATVRVKANGYMSAPLSYQLQTSTKP